MLRANVLGIDCAYDATDPTGYRSAVADIGKAVGGKALATKVYELPAVASQEPGDLKLRA